VDAAVHNNLDEVGGWLDIAATGPANQQDSQGLPLSFRIDYLRSVTAIHDVGLAEEAGRRAASSAPFPRWEGIAWCGVGQALYLQDRFDEAQVCLRTSVALIPDANPILLLTARANLVLVEAASSTAPLPERALDGALELLRRAGAENSPAGALIEMAWGEVRRTRGELGEAVVHFEASLELLGAVAPSCLHANAFLLLSQVQYALGDSDQAMLSLDAADSILSRQRDPGALPDRVLRLRQNVVTPPRRSAGYGEELTDRESAVLGLLADGRSQREIATSLFISHNTVKTHLRNVYRKLGVTSRDAAVRQAPSHGKTATS
jgi:LuxR family maltose regulon positive regulatory protein